jgi:hypothetical protein
MLAISGSASAQVTVNGKVPGDLWRTSQVDGVVEVFHIWGRTVTMPVKEAWVNIEGDRISVGAKCDQPVLDGKRRDGYHMADMTGEVSKEFPTQIQTITKTEMTGIGDDEEFRTTKTAMVVMKDGKPESLVFTCVDYSTFDIAAFIERMNANGSELAKRSTEGLDEFDRLGFRVRTFRAVFR